MKEAYSYYTEVDPSPVSLNGFRSLVSAGIIPAIRTANDPKAPVVGFKKRTIDGFLAARHRLAERNAPPKPSETPKDNTKVVKEIMDAVVARAKPKLEALREVAKTSSKKSKTQASSRSKTQENVVRWVPVKEAYAYYSNHADKPYTESWFRNKVYRSETFRTKLEKDERSNNPSGKKYYVDLDSVDEYLREGGLPKSKPRPKPTKTWPVEMAYHKFRHVIPPGLSLLQFKRLVNQGLIHSVKRGSVDQVGITAVEKYFQGGVELDPSTLLSTGSAYDYYCSRCSDPVAKAHFARWVAQGEIAGGRQVEGLWKITMQDINDFLSKYPSGRMRINRNSRVAADTREEPRGAAKPQGKKSVSEPQRQDNSAGTISVSMSNYASPEEMRKALEILTSQGFQVDVKP